MHHETKANISEMLCRMPVVSLPHRLREQLKNSTSETINSTQGPGVADYTSADKRLRADIYVGIKFDGFKLYQNISAVEPNITMQFSLQPSVSCRYEDLDFDPKSEKLIIIKVNVKNKYGKY